MPTVYRFRLEKLEFVLAVAGKDHVVVVQLDQQIKDDIIWLIVLIDDIKKLIDTSTKMVRGAKLSVLGKVKPRLGTIVWATTRFQVVTPSAEQG